MVEIRRLGVTKNSAPASMQMRALSGSRTVPAPSSNLSPNWSATFSRAFTAPGTVIVISAARIPPSYKAPTTLTAASAVEQRTTGTRPASVRNAIISLEVMCKTMLHLSCGTNPVVNRLKRVLEGSTVLVNVLELEAIRAQLDRILKSPQLE